MRWFRFYTEALNDPKVQVLSGDVFKTWVNLLCVTSQVTSQVTSTFVTRDKIGVTREAAAFYLRMGLGEANDHIDELVRVGLLHDDGVLIPHNWEKRQYKSDTSAARTKEYRGRKQQKNGDVTVTSHETSHATSLRRPQIQITDKDKDIRKDKEKEKEKKINKKKEKEKEICGGEGDAASVLEFLNAKAGRQFRPTKATLQPIVDRLREGHSVTTCCQVVIVKCDDWRQSRDPIFQSMKYAQPATLFGKLNFKKYLALVHERFGDQCDE